LLSQPAATRPRVGITVTASPQNAHWTSSDGQPVWRAELASPGAAAIRLHFRDFHIGNGTLRITSPSGDDILTYTADGILNDGDFWSSIVPGDRALVEFTPHSPDSLELPFSLTEVAHFYPPSIKTGAAIERQIEACHIDPITYPQWQPPSTAVTLLVFQTTELGVPYWTVCTGTLLADRNQSRRPLLLTANHCIRTTDEARSLETYFHFQTTPTQSFGYSDRYGSGFWIPASLGATLTKVTGATILTAVSGSEGDATLLELSAPPPATAAFAAYNPAELPLNTATATLHHPDGSFKRLASGDRVPTTSGNETGIRLNDKFRPSDYYYKIRETLGLTEAGSSGSAAFTASFLASGTLSYGPTVSCSSNNRFGVYGRSSTFYPRIQHILHNTAPGACNVEFNAPNQTVSSSSQQSTFQIIAPASCNWAVASDSEHISVNNKAGTGSATVVFQVTANTDPVLTTQSRIGSISIIGEQRRVFHIMQRGTETAAFYFDLPAGHPFAEEIKLLKLRNVTAYGCPQPSSFCPEATTTRGQMAEFIIRAIYNGDNFPAPVNLPGDFSDVPPQHPAYRYVQKMRELRITDGCTTTTYCPEDPVTRGQMAAFVIRALQVKNGLDSRAPFSFSSQTYFSDNSPLNPFHSAVQKMKEVGITSGCTATSYCINDPNTRGQIAVFLARGLFALWEGR
jgi:hypothetical protein